MIKPEKARIRRQYHKIFLEKIFEVKNKGEPSRGLLMRCVNFKRCTIPCHAKRKWMRYVCNAEDANELKGRLISREEFN